MEKREEDSDDPHTSLYTLTIPMDTRSKHKVRHTNYSVLLQDLKEGGGGGLSTFKLLMPWHIHCYSLLLFLCCVNTVKRRCCAPPLGETLLLCKTSSLHDSEQH